MAWTVPRTWVAGEIVTAAMLNVHIRDNLNSLGAVWTSYTPAWTASTTNPVLNNGTILGRYAAFGKFVCLTTQVTFGSTTTYGSGNFLISLPLAPLTGVGSVLLVAITGLNATNTSMGLTSVLSAQAGPAMWAPSDTNMQDFNTLSASTVGGWASGDSIRMFGCYQAA